MKHLKNFNEKIQENNSFNKNESLLPNKGYVMLIFLIKEFNFRKSYLSIFINKKLLITIRDSDENIY